MVYYILRPRAGTQEARETANLKASYNQPTWELLPSLRDSCLSVLLVTWGPKLGMRQMIVSRYSFKVGLSLSSPTVNRTLTVMLNKIRERCPAHIQNVMICLPQENCLRVLYLPSPILQLPTLHRNSNQTHLTPFLAVPH
ncbi:uncharacterized protein LACBIDRAFT_304598 [Laccaria bicolor S238N-H82]|uniref:Predicted protein n=1 Tax=Laccaria bicolor (strain S238N-H82 / ATCC MYA-4686) TaxID=486041 RepID=B0DLZ5_LACBS|nr:uncharacterized protein LACBIDRAFT_304598 [Laccaria bicolor S238N-H82]EDR04381.1 predicted protein [Laccaria bicolor S238N-H82]|eukprot:XP_001884900.1 predicted protein [Laccaria bicolor S238N-H82]